MQRPIANGTFQMKDPAEWGFTISSDKIEDNLEKYLKNILDKVYESMKAHEKVKAIYMPWYNTQDNNQKFHTEIVPNLIEKEEGIVTDGKTSLVWSILKYNLRYNTK